MQVEEGGHCALKSATVHIQISRTFSLSRCLQSTNFHVPTLVSAAQSFRVSRFSNHQVVHSDDQDTNGKYLQSADGVWQYNGNEGFTSKSFQPVWDAWMRFIQPLVANVPMLATLGVPCFRILKV